MAHSFENLLRDLGGEGPVEGEGAGVVTSGRLREVGGEGGGGAGKQQLGLPVQLMEHSQIGSQFFSTK